MSRPFYLPFLGDIRVERIESLLVDLQAMPNPKGVFVDSPGGNFLFFSWLAPAIERQGIVTLAGNVDSAAVILFLLGHTRRAFPDSTFFFHEIRAVPAHGSVTLCDIEEALEIEERMEAEKREGLEEWRFQMRAAQNWFIGFVAEKTGIAPSIFLNLMRGNATLSAFEARRYGIVHEILPEGVDWR